MGLPTSRPIRAASSTATGSAPIAAGLGRPHRARRRAAGHQAQTAHLPNAPFAIDDPKASIAAQRTTQRSVASVLPKSDADRRRQERRFVAFANSGALVMGHYDGAKTAALARRAELRARRQFLHGRVRRLFPQSFLSRLRVRAALSERRQEPGQGPDRGRRARRRFAEARSPIRRNRRSMGFQVRR